MRCRKPSIPTGTYVFLNSTIYFCAFSVQWKTEGFSLCFYLNGWILLLLFLFFLYNLFNDAVHNSDYIGLKDRMLSK